MTDDRLGANHGRLEAVVHIVHLTLLVFQQPVQGSLGCMKLINLQAGANQNMLHSRWIIAHM